MPAKSPANYRHYNHLPICGYCVNAWDIIYKRPPWNKRRDYDAARWVGYCRHGGCDPDVWDYMEMRKPPTDDRVFHRRGSGEAWRRQWPRVVAQFCSVKNAQFQTVTDQRGNVLSKVVPDDDIDWDEPEAAVVSDDDIEW